MLFYRFFLIFNYKNCDTKRLATVDYLYSPFVGKRNSPSITSCSYTSWNNNITSKTIGTSTTMPMYLIIDDKSVILVVVALRFYSTKAKLYNECKILEEA